MALTITLTAPNAGLAFEVGATFNLGITGSTTTGATGISSVIANIDGGPMLNTWNFPGNIQTEAFNGNVVVPGTLAVGNHTLKVISTDSAAVTAEADVNLIVNAVTPLMKMGIPPDQAFFTGEQGQETLATQLDGGAGRYRGDILNASLLVTVRWSINPSDYDYLWAFYRSASLRGSQPFLIDLPLESSSMLEHTAYFVPKSLKCAGVSGATFVMTATLEVLPNIFDSGDDDLILSEYTPL